MKALVLALVAASLAAIVVAQAPVTVLGPVPITGGPVLATGSPLVAAPIPTRLVNAFGAAGTLTNPLMVATVAPPADPCTTAAKLTIGITQTASAQVIAGVPGKRFFLCNGQIGPNSDAENTSLVEGTGAVCATGLLALAGGTTAAAGLQNAANGGSVLGEIVARVAGDNGCLLQSGSGTVAGFVTVAFQ